jgi:VWFA-related protein
MQRLADQTGGTAFLSNRVDDLEPIFVRISSELRAQYLLTYYSANSRTDGSFRHIVVRLPGRPELRIRARRGYYA